MDASRYTVPRQLRVPLLAVNALLAATLLVIHLASGERAPAPFSKGGLASLPKQVEGWRGEDGEWKSETVTAIGAEDWLLRRYQDLSGSAVWLYVGFHSDVSFAGSSPHSPLLCYPGQGWVLIDSTIEQIPLAEGSSIPVNRLLVQKGLEQRLVLYWFQWGNEVTAEDSAGDYGAKVSWLLRLPFLMREQARTDRSLVRVSARVGLSRERTFAAGTNFIQAMFPLLAEHFELVTQRPSTELDGAAPASSADDRSRS